jgi:hypothetical protein
MVGFAGSTMGGGFGNGPFVAVLVWRATVFAAWVEAALCDSGTRSTVVAVDSGRFGASTIPSPINTSRSSRLTMLASPRPDKRRCSGVRS